MRQRLLLLVLLFVPVAAAVSAQPSAGPAVIRPTLEVQKARVYVATLLPHAPAASPNGHAINRVILHLDAGTMTIRNGDGAVESLQFARGDVRWRPAGGAYVAENTSDHPIRLLEIDLKGAPAGPAPQTPLDAPVVDPTRYRVVLDNPQVRVLRVHFQPHDVGARHEHMLNRIVVYMNDQGPMRADDVRMSGPAVHVERNDADTPADRIAVELK